MALDGTEAGLTASVADWLARDDLTAFVPDFLVLAYAYLDTERRLRVREAEDTATLTLTAGVGTIPSDYAGFREAWANTSPQSPLELVTTDAAREAYSDSPAGIPYVCTIVGSSLTTFPTTTATVGLIYYRKASAWLLAAHPHVMLYATLAQSAPFIRDDARLGVWNTMLEKALDDIKKSDEAQRYGRVRSRVKGPTP